MDNSFKYTCLVLNTFVNIYIFYVIMQLIVLSGDLCCKHVLKVCLCTSLSQGIYPVLKLTVVLSFKRKKNYMKYFFRQINAFLRQT